MEVTKKQKDIYETVNGIFSRAIELKNSGMISRYFQFLKRVPDHAPFNNTLVFIQNPDCSYYATASQWAKRFGRTIRQKARPMIILFPFGPVEFVYDIDDTEGAAVTNDNILFWWRKHGGTLGENVFENTRMNLEQLGIDFKELAAGQYFERHSLLTGGYAQRSISGNELNIVLHPRYSEANIESYGVLCHEIAHILLGHLGDVTLPSATNGRRLNIARDRREIPKSVMEIEAELVAWIVFSGFGIEKSSEAYIASWLVEKQDSEMISMGDVLRVAGKIQEMGRRTNIYGQSAKKSS